jgi:hypothetical protein
MKRRRTESPPGSAGPSLAGSRKLTLALLLAAVGLACGIGFVGWPAPFVRVPHGLPEFPPAPGLAFRSVVLGDPNALAQVTNVQIVDIDGDGQKEVLVCDAVRQAILVYRRGADDQWQEQVIADGLPAPAHVTVVDLDQDGDLDLVVAVLGTLFPSDELVGKVVWLENVGGKYRPHVLLEDVRRVADVQAGDLDGDGDIDLAVAVFGHTRGEVLWLENRGGGAFLDHQLLDRPGAIHVPLADYDGDGDLDIAVIVSQDEEELWAFENLGGGQFTRRRLWHNDNYDVGSAGLVAADVDQDGDMDLVLPQGDNLEDITYWPQPYHGCTWLENRGGWNFVEHRMADVGLTYAAAVSDLDGDGHRDVVLALMAHDLDDPRQASLVWLRNDGAQHFTPYRIASEPYGLVAVACGDLNGDGRPDIVATGLRTHHSSTRVNRVTLWLSQEPER